MSDIIRLLPDSVANQIAAGEVIQRPASVIKELVENAVDAGADDIRIYIKDGGRTLIQVIDNGKGMSETDARMAFERHATSKIRQASDLFELHTMGFRGEALPSICAIAQVELRTRRPEDRTGTCIVINGSRLEKQEPCVCESGSNFMVKNLFFNAPARRKFMKNDNVELSHIMREFERLALVNNGIRMFIDTGTRQLDLRAANFRQRISDLWKNNLNSQLLPVDVETSLIKISGYISRPEFARRRNPLQYLIVNGRNMRHPYFSRAILNCYDSLIAQGTQPCYFLKFEVDPASIDVNVHPTKNEIKFENESEIWSILTACVKNALGKFSAVPSIDFSSDTIEVRRPEEGSHLEVPKVNMTPGFNPFKPQGGRVEPPASRPSARGWENLYADFMKEARSNAGQQPRQQEQPSLIDDEPAPAMPLCLQLDRKYIVTTSENGLTLIDQHRAHVRILYERILEAARKEKPVMQSLMFPETITLEGTQIEAYARIADEIAKMGFRLEYVEDSQWQVTGAPALISERNPRRIVMRIIDSVCDDPEALDAAGGELLENVALLTARSMAIERGQRLTPREMEQLMADLFQLPEPKYTPNGNLILLEIPFGRISALFA